MITRLRSMRHQTSSRDGARVLASATTLLLILATAALAAPGRTDTTFGGDGRVVRDLAPREQVAAAETVAGKKLVVAGWANDRSSRPEQPFIARFKRDGKLDRAFGQRGRLFLNVPGDAGAIVNDMTIADDGAILLATTIFEPDLPGDCCRFGVARMNSSGALDSSFGDQGWAIDAFVPDTESHAGGIATTSDGGVAVSGTSAPGGGNFGVARLTPQGELDSEFAGDGTTTVDFSILPDLDGSTDVAVTSGDAIVPVGYAYEYIPGEEHEFDLNIAVARLLPTGDLDPSFAHAGRLLMGSRFGEAETAQGVAVKGARALVIAGGHWVARVGGDGEPQESFGRAGLRKLDFNGGAKRYNEVTDVGLAGNRILAGGFTRGRHGRRTGLVGNFALARLRLNGDFDKRFGDNGRVLTNMGRGLAQAQALTVTGERRVTLAGTLRFRRESDTALARYRLR